MEVEPPLLTSHRWAARDPATVEGWRRCSPAPECMATVMARTLAERIDDIVRIDRMTTVAGTRRDAILRRIDERRAALARRLSEAAGRAETAQLNTMENAPAVAPG
jgi:hypothetical protein